MTLQVPFDDFASAAQRFEIKEAYLHSEAGATEVSGCNPKLGVTLLTQTSQNFSEAKRKLEDQGLTAFRGIWSENRVPLEEQGPEVFVAAVSYLSGNPIPGLWIDAYEGEPNHIEVLETLYHEFRETGELPEVTIEEFLRATNPNVLVLSETRLRAFIQSKREKKPC